MADPKTSVLLSLPGKKRYPLTSLSNGEITPEMYDSINQLKAFKGSREEAAIFLGDMIKELVTHVLIPPPH